MLWTLFKKFFMIGLFSFGGGYAMLPLFEKEFIRSGIITNDRFLEIMTISQMTPGSFAINAATFIGKDNGGILGALISTIAVSLPSLLILLIFMKTLTKYKNNPLKIKIFDGLRPAVLGFVLAAVFLLGKESTFDVKNISYFAISMILLMTNKVHPILVIFLMGGANILL
ncbi:chromate transporter [Ezakiella coagulans]|uniref:chromate transporter n=1 Tax=Ezakiella coagulans TaxID=46507 RepID=UPI002014F4D0|nr:chromate transporter [Ezakiella coagulans]UQK59880.1 chromate transporter [Ezakiella coagulans]